MNAYFLIAASLISSLANGQAVYKLNPTPVVDIASTVNVNSTVITTIPAIRETRTMWVTAYTSVPEETDETPFITASGSHVRDGIVATNMLPFGTKVQIPEFFGNKIFVVEDRMHKRKVNYLDIWMAEKGQALHFGKNQTEIVVLNES